MSLLAPALLLGLGLLAVPVIVHLTRRQRSRVTPFPSLMFLRKVPFKTTRRRRIRHPVLFALRCLAVVLIALAFARPFVATDHIAMDAARDVVLLLDRSGSMAAGDRIEAAREAAREVLGGLATEDRVALVTFDDRATERVALTSDRAAVRAALDGLPRSDRPTRLEAGLQLAGRILEGSERTRRDVVLVSDYQRTGWEDGSGTRLPDGVTLRTVPVGETTDNVSVADVRVAPGSGDRHRVTARVVNLGSSAIAALDVVLELEGRAAATSTIELESAGTATVLFDEIAIPSGAPRGRVHLAGGGAERAGGLGTDDELHFIAAVAPAMDVILVDAPRGRADRSLFLTRALDLGELPRLRVTRRPAPGLDGAILDASRVVVLNDAVPPGQAEAARLGEWVVAGGALFVALGPESAPERWAGRDSVLLGGQVGDVADRAARAGSRLAWLDYDHPVFSVFAAPGSGDFSAARFWRFREFEPGEGTRVLARFEDGEPALLERTLGEGRVLTWTSTLDRFWNDLALQPVFLPFIHRVVRHAAAFEEPERWLEAGTSRELVRLLDDAAGPTGPSARGLDPDTEWVLVTPGGERRPIQASPDGRPRWIEFERAGFYRVEPLDGGSGALSVAVNLPLREADLRTVAPERLAADVTGAGADVTGAAADSRQVTGERSAGVPARRELWWPLLLLALGVLVAESWMANRWSRRGVSKNPGARKERSP